MINENIKYIKMITITLLLTKILYKLLTIIFKSRSLCQIKMTNIFEKYEDLIIVPNSLFDMYCVPYNTKIPCTSNYRAIVLCPVLDNVIE